MPEPDPVLRGSGSVFPTTHWTLIQVVQTGSEAEAAQALEALCGRYWYPIYAYLRRRGFEPPDAEDLTQAFFHELISEEVLRAARQERGPLRGFLLGVLQRLLADHLRQRGAQKRGSGVRTISLEEMAAEKRYGGEPVDERDPERLFAEAWAREVFAGVREKLRVAFATAGRAETFEVLLPFLLGEEAPPSQREIAEKLGASENAVGILVHRLRQTFRELLEEEIAATVLSPEEVPGEMAWFQRMLRGQ